MRAQRKLRPVALKDIEGKGDRFIFCVKQDGIPLLNSRPCKRRDAKTRKGRSARLPTPRGATRAQQAGGVCERSRLPLLLEYLGRVQGTVRCKGIRILFDDQPRSPYLAARGLGNWDGAVDEAPGRSTNTVRQSTGMANGNALGKPIQIQSNGY